MDPHWELLLAGSTAGPALPSPVGYIVPWVGLGPAESVPRQTSWRQHLILGPILGQFADHNGLGLGPVSQIWAKFILGVRCSFF